MKSNELLALAKDALAAAGEAEVEIFARSRSRGVARFAIGELGQHMQLEESSVVVRVARGKRVAESSTSALDQGAIVETIRRAAEIAAVAPALEGFPGFGDGDTSSGVHDVPRKAASTVAATAGDRVALLVPALEKIRACGLTSAGVLETNVGAQAVATTRGCARAHDDSIASYRVWACETAGSGGASGYGSHMHRDLGKVDVVEETERAIRLCELGKDPKPLAAGTYDVVMEPAAVCELLEWLGMIAFTAADVEQGTSALAGRFGESVTGASVDITEDPLDPSELGFGAPFDREGTLRKSVPIIAGGVAKNVLTDRTYASRRNETSTGSSVLASIGGGSSIAAVALQLGAGKAASVDELVSGIDRGLYVCRLHYVNGMLEPRRAVMTGLTRDGCFWVENGKIQHAVGNLRFTDSVLEGFARIDAMTAGRKAIPTWWSPAGAYVAPAIRMRQFRFNGKSQEAPALG